MKNFATALVLELLIVALVGGAVMVLSLGAGERAAALLGVGVSGLLGALALLVKTQVAKLSTKGVKQLLSAQVSMFLLRLVAVGVGALALRGDEASSPVAFVLAFFAVYLGQQVVEVRSVLAVRQPAKSGVTP